MHLHEKHASYLRYLQNVNKSKKDSNGDYQSNCHRSFCASNQSNF